LLFLPILIIKSRKTLSIILKISNNMKKLFIILTLLSNIGLLVAQIPTRNTSISVSPETVRTPVTEGEDITPTPPTKDDYDIPYHPPTRDDENPNGEDPNGGLGENGKPLRIIWALHGLGGDKDSWSRVQSFINSKYKAQSPKLTYTENVTLEEAATEPYDLIRGKNDVYVPLGYDREQTYFIAHSQGGLVGRSMETYMPPGEFGGFATFGSPHKGAFIINNKQQLTSFGTSTAVGLAAGPLAEESYKILPNNKVFEFFFQNKINSVVVSVVSKAQQWGNKFIPQFIDGLAANTFTPITDDYKVGAPALNALTNNPKTKKVCFVGIETEPVFYREVYGAEIKVPNAFNLWGAGPDQELVDDANDTYADYLAKYTDYKNKANNASSKSKKAKYDYLANEFLNGCRVLNNSNDYWKHIIGGLQWIPNGQQYCQCREKDDHGWSYYTYQGPCKSNSGLNCETKNYLQLVSEANDGVVPVSHQVFSGANSIYNMPGSNHQQMRNDGNTKTAIKNLLLEGGADKYFFTEEK
jgi:hypothetical protein